MSSPAGAKRDGGMLKKKLCLKAQIHSHLIEFVHMTIS